MMYKFGVCGPFDFEEKGTGGQSVKTREFYYALCEAVGKENTLILESTDYRKNPVSFFFSYLKMLRCCEHIVILPAQNGIHILAPLSVWFRGKGKIHYSVIGGWLPELIRKNHAIKYYLSKLNTILVETNVMKNELESQGLTNVKRLLNFKRLTPVDEHEIRINTPLRLCYFSRVTKEKGIEDAVAIVKAINIESKRCSFDIYGPIITTYEKEFEQLQKSFTPEIRYCGRVAPEYSIETLKDYDIQIFPTRYPTEGIPGSIIDSYFAAVPVLAARWNSFEDVVKEGITGIGYSQGNLDDLYSKLDWLINDRSKIIQMKRNCLSEAQKYLPKKVIHSFFDIIAYERLGNGNQHL